MNSINCIYLVCLIRGRNVSIRRELAKRFSDNHPILDALDRSSVDFASFGVWGSPAFFA